MVKQKKNSNLKQQAFISLAIFLLVLIGINVLSSYFFHRIDLTKEKRFTLTSSTKELVKSLDDVVFVNVYLEGEFPSGFKRLRNSTAEMLNEFRSYAGNNIEFRFFNPLEGVSEEEKYDIVKELADKGIQPTNLQVKGEESYSEQIIFPAATFYYKGKETSVQLLENKIGQGPQAALNQSISLLEYKFAQAINSVNRPYKPKIGIIQGHGELTPGDMQSMVNLLTKDYVVERFDMDKHLYIPELFKTIIIAKPTQKFSEPDKYKIDQFIMNGGSVLWLIDPMIAHLDSLRNNNAFMSVERDLNLDDMLFKYGVRVNKNLVQDLQCNPIPLMIGMMGDTPQYDLFSWYYYPVLTSGEQKHPISKNIDALQTKFISTIDTVKSIGINKSILLNTSPYSKVLFSPVRVHLSMLKEEPNREQFNKGNQPVAVLLEGEFPSVFANRLKPSTKTITDTISAFTNRPKSLPAKMIVIGDGDFIANERNANGESLPTGFYKPTKETFANQQFLLNAIEYLMDNNGLISSRSREVKLRLLDLGKVKSEKTFWQLLNIVLPILLVLVFGFAYNFYRKRKFTS